MWVRVRKCDTSFEILYFYVFFFRHGRAYGIQICCAFQLQELEFRKMAIGKEFSKLPVNPSAVWPRGRFHPLSCLPMRLGGCALLHIFSGLASEYNKWELTSSAGCKSKQFCACNTCYQMKIIAEDGGFWQITVLKLYSNLFEFLF